VAREGLDGAQAPTVLDASGQIVAPGFVDQHAHVQAIADYPLAENFIRQGITSIVSSPHSGEQVHPLDAYIAKLRVAPNIGYFAGHSSTRRRVLGMASRAPTAAELIEMKRLVEEAMRQGALGLSTGVAVPPGSHASLDEIIELAKVAAAHGGIYVSHVREDFGGVLDAVNEVVRVAEAAGIPGQVSHHRVAGAAQWGWSQKTLGLVDAAHARGLDIALDIYPYTAAVVQSSAFFGASEGEGGTPRELSARLQDRAERAGIEEALQRALRSRYVGDDLARIRFQRVKSLPAYEGKTLADLARDRGLPVSAASGAALIAELQAGGGFAAVVDALHEDDLRRFMRHAATLFDTEGPVVGLGDGEPHPRTYGSFPRILARYVREQKVLTLEEAMRKMTSVSADQIGQRDRGRIIEGVFADVTVFDAAAIADRATYDDPHQFAIGVRHVIINGVPVLRAGALTGERPGRALKGPARRTGDRQRGSPGELFFRP
jgi:N-acyl-D-aspartate/D-glutamate deacylase